MKRSVLLAVAIAIALGCGVAWGQFRGGMGHPGGAGTHRPGPARVFIGSGPGFGAGPGFGPGCCFPDGRFSHRRFSHFRGYAPVFFPDYYYPFGYGYDEAYYEPPIELAQMPQVIVDGARQAPPATAAASAPAPARPKMIELPQARRKAKARTNAPNEKPVAPTVFVFTDGTRLESQRYLLTANALDALVDGQQRRYPITKLDMKATVAANRERGVELQMPTSSHEVFLGF